jgi:hypothetical protein
MTAPDPVADRTGLRIVLVVIGTMLVWAMIANMLGGEVGFAAAAVLGAGAATVVWRELITYELLSNVALVGLPVVVVGLSLA